MLTVVGSGLQVCRWDFPSSLVFYFVGILHPTPMPTCQTTACTEAAPVGGEGESSQETQPEVAQVYGEKATQSISFHNPDPPQVKVTALYALFTSNTTHKSKDKGH